MREDGLTNKEKAKVGAEALGLAALSTGQTVLTTEKVLPAVLNRAQKGTVPKALKTPLRFAQKTVDKVRTPKGRAAYYGLNAAQSLATGVGIAAGRAAAKRKRVENQVEKLSAFDIVEAMGKIAIDAVQIPVDSPNFDQDAIRKSIIGELETINLYNWYAENTKDPRLAKEYRDISREEEKHIGELLNMLTYTTATDLFNVADGIEESKDFQAGKTDDDEKTAFEIVKDLCKLAVEDDSLYTEEKQEIYAPLQEGIANPPIQEVAQVGLSMAVDDLIAKQKQKAADVALNAQGIPVDADVINNAPVTLADVVKP